MKIKPLMSMRAKRLDRTSKHKSSCDQQNINTQDVLRYAKNTIANRVGGTVMRQVSYEQNYLAKKSYVE